MPNYPDAEVWPDDDIADDNPKGDELAREVLDGAEYAEYRNKKRGRSW